MTKKEKILKEIDNLIDELINTPQPSSGYVGALQETTNASVVVGLEMAKKVVNSNL